MFHSPPVLRSALLVVLSLTLLGAGGRERSQGGELRAAACKRVITPVVGVNHTNPIFMAGFGNDRHATDVHDELWARGIVVEAGSTKLAIVTLDVVGYFNNEVRTIRALVDPARDFDAITVTSTHNHEGPDTVGLWGPDETMTGADLGYLDFVNEQVAACIEEADDALGPAEIRFATGSTAGTSLPPWTDLVADGKVLESIEIDLSLVGGEGVLRVDGDDGPVLNASVPVLQLRRRWTAESRLAALRAWLKGGADRPDLRPGGAGILATLVNFASHPESLGSNNTSITSDFPHYMREALEARYGGVAIYMSADLGVLQGPLDVDVTDASTGEPVPRRSFAFAQRMGELLAERAARALDAERGWQSRIELRAATRSPVFVEVENPFFIALNSFGVFGRRPIAAGGENTVESEAQALRIGDAIIAVTPNELDPQIGNLYRDRMAAPHRFVAGLGNDELGYQMPAAKFNPSCFLCFAEVLFGREDLCPVLDTLDCGTVFINNIGPGMDGQLQGIFEELLAELE